MFSPHSATTWPIHWCRWAHLGASLDLYVKMTRAFNEGTVKPRNGRTAENTTPTRFEDFAEELARAYRAA